MRKGFFAGFLGLILPIIGEAVVFAQAVPPNTVPPNTVPPNNVPAITVPSNSLRNPTTTTPSVWDNGRATAQPGTSRAPITQPQPVAGQYGTQPDVNPYQYPGSGSQPSVAPVAPPYGNNPIAPVRDTNPTTRPIMPNPYENPQRTTVPGTPRIAMNNTAPASPQAPFRLTQAEENDLNRFLTAWENYGEKVKSFETLFDCFAYLNWDSKDPNVPQNSLSYCTRGEFKYNAPNQILFHVTGEWIDKKIQHGRHEAKFLADGTAYYSFDCIGTTDPETGKQVKTVEKYIISEDQQKAGLMSGPLPFIFGAKAIDMKARYFLRIKTPEEHLGKQVWIEAFPKWIEDSAEYKSIMLIIDSKTFLPIALQKNHLNKNYEVFSFIEPSASSKPLQAGLMRKNPFDFKNHSSGYQLFVRDMNEERPLPKDIMNTPPSVGPTGPRGANDNIPRTAMGESNPPLTVNPSPWNPPSGPPSGAGGGRTPLYSPTN